MLPLSWILVGHILVSWCGCLDNTTYSGVFVRYGLCLSLQSTNCLYHFVPPFCVATTLSIKLMSF